MTFTVRIIDVSDLCNEDTGVRSIEIANSKCPLYTGGSLGVAQCNSACNSAEIRVSLLVLCRYFCGTFGRHCFRHPISSAYLVFLLVIRLLYRFLFISPLFYCSFFLVRGHIVVVFGMRDQVICYERQDYLLSLCVYR